MKKMLKWVIKISVGLVVLIIISFAGFVGYLEFEEYSASKQADDLYNDLIQLTDAQIMDSDNEKRRKIFKKYDSICYWYGKGAGYGTPPQENSINFPKKLLYHPCVSDSSMPVKDIVEGSNYVYIEQIDYYSTRVTLYSGDNNVINKTILK